MAKAKTIVIPSPVDTFDPTFDISENIAPDIVGKKKGQAVQILINYQVIEKTKSFTVLRVNSMSLQVSKRKF